MQSIADGLDAKETWEYRLKLKREWNITWNSAGRVHDAKDEARRLWIEIGGINQN